MRADRTTNEQEFQGQVVTWFNEAIGRNPGLGLDRATQEPSKVTRKRNDVVVWFDRPAERALLTGELKTPTTLLSDPDLLQDANRKAQRWAAPVFFIWNMQAAELYRTPPSPQAASPADRLTVFPIDSGILSVDDWLRPVPQRALHERALAILDKAVEALVTPAAPSRAIDATIFVQKLEVHLRTLREIIADSVRSHAAVTRGFRIRLRQIAAKQGFLGFVEDLDDAIAGQYAYRVVGQVLFYFALRRRLPTLPPLTLSRSASIPSDLTPFWNEVRRYDYDALFLPSELDGLIDLPSSAQSVLRDVIADWSEYDWGSLQDDVLGAIFEHLIPAHEQKLLGQFYTPRRVADLILAFVLEGERPEVLDPGCGSGTFLMRAYSRLRDSGTLSHADLLGQLWGFDVSAFACELAVINLFRQDFSQSYNFPRILCADFFDMTVGSKVEFPPPKAGVGSRTTLTVPQFDAVVGNPPYLRSQNQDDLDPRYRTKLFSAAAKAGVKAIPKTDLFGFFAYHSMQFLRDGGRLGFVTSASWLTTQFGAQLQKLLLERCRIIAIVWSSCESFFSQVDVNTVLVITQKRGGSNPDADEVIRFVTLKRTLADLFPESADHWTRIQELADSVEAVATQFEDSRARVVVRSAALEMEALTQYPKVPRNWSQYLRAPLSYFQLFGDGA